MSPEQRDGTAPFGWLNKEYVLDNAAREFNASKIRSLWQRLRQEFDKGGVGNADTYLGSLFSDVRQDIEESLTAFRESGTGAK